MKIWSFPKYEIEKKAKVGRVFVLINCLATFSAGPIVHKLAQFEYCKVDQFV